MPNLNQILFYGVKILELIIPKNRKINAINKNHILIGSLLSKGHIAIIRKTTKKTIPKFRFELIFIFLFANLY